MRGFFFFIQGLILVHFWGLLVLKWRVNSDQITPPPAPPARQQRPPAGHAPHTPPVSAPRRRDQAAQTPQPTRDAHQGRSLWSCGAHARSPTPAQSPPAPAGGSFSLNCRQVVPRPARTRAQRRHGLLSAVCGAHRARRTAPAGCGAHASSCQPASRPSG